MRKNVAGVLGAFGLVAALGYGSANAALIVDGGLTLDTAPGVSYQQTNDDPCIIGGKDCKNPADFPYTVADSSGAGSKDYYSPVYTLAQVTGTLDGQTTFIVGFDYNDTSKPQTLQYFSACYTSLGGTACQVFDTATDLKTIYNGTGFSDFLLSGFSIPNGTLTIQFHATWLGNDGPDSYFLIGGENPPFYTPEPAMLGLLGLGLAGIAAIRRRRAD